MQPKAPPDPADPRAPLDADLRTAPGGLERMLDTVMDAIVAIDDERRVTLFNRAAEAAFRCPAASMLGQPLTRLLSERFQELLDVSMREFAQSQWTRHYMWAEKLTAFRADGSAFPIDVSISPFTVDRQRQVALILRDAAIRQRGERELREVRRENARLQAVIHAEARAADIIGTSASMQALLQGIDRVARTDATVLILGETGTGKELLARSVHRLSRRKDQPMVTVNCATLSAGLVESELFGHEKGAFTGAIARKIGRFELADRGTLFLDEIGEVPLDLQAKLLRVLQEGTFERVGGTTVRTADVRVIAATNRDLRRSVAAGHFREDLYYRLHVFPVHVPPLRERRDDIPLLATTFVEKYGKRIGRRIATISPQVLDALASYDWPGNVRELEHVIERGVILSDGARLDVGEWLPRRAPLTTRVDTRTLDTVVRDYIVETLERSQWKVSGPQGAAQRLGLKPTTLEARMHKLGIVRPRP